MERNGWVFDEGARVLLPKQLQHEWSCLQVCVQQRLLIKIWSQTTIFNNSYCTLFVCLGARRWWLFSSCSVIISFWHRGAVYSCPSVYHCQRVCVTRSLLQGGWQFKGVVCIHVNRTLFTFFEFKGVIYTCVLCARSQDHISSPSDICKNVASLLAQWGVSNSIDPTSECFQLLFIQGLLDQCSPSEYSMGWFMQLSANINSIGIKISQYHPLSITICGFTKQRIVLY